jgi:hypothetical protein
MSKTRIFFETNIGVFFYIILLEKTTENQDINAFNGKNRPKTFEIGLYVLFFRQVSIVRIFWPTAGEAIFY